MKARAFMLLVGIGILPFDAHTAEPERPAFAPKKISADSGNPLSSAINPTLEHFKLSVELRFEKSRFRLGEPVHFQLVVKNASDSPLWVANGGDYRNSLGRPESFTIKVVDGKGEPVPQPQVRLDMGGMIYLVPLPAHGEMAYDLFLPHWALFERPGGYTIEVARTLALTTRNEVDDLIVKERVAHLPVTATAMVNVLPADAVELGKLIDQWGASVINKGDQKSFDKLKAAGDDRTIPWFLKMLDLQDTDAQMGAISYLGKQNSKEAFEGVKQCFISPKASSENRSRIEQSAAHSFLNSPYPEALPFLLSQREHPNPRVRLAVAHALAKEKRTKEAFSMYRDLAQDKDEAVRRSAEFWLKDFKGN